MTGRAEIVAAARGWVGTPFAHQGRRKGVGVDCVGLLIGVARELGLGEVDYAAYDRRPDPAMVGRLLARHMRRRPPYAPEPGDALLLAAPMIPCHVGIVAERRGEPSLIHAWVVAGRCEEHVLGFWRRRIRACYRFPGVA